MLVPVLLFGVAIASLGVLGLVRPRTFIACISGTWNSRAGLVVAVGTRLLLGFFLIASASQSRFGSAFRVLGVVSLIGAALIPVLGRGRVQRWIDWWNRQPPTIIRLWSLAVVGFGAFLIYGAL